MIILNCIGRFCQSNYLFSIQVREVSQNKNINLVFLALPTIDRFKRNQIIENLNQFKLVVKTLPSISEIVDEK